MLTLKLLGTAAGGGFPQWNCSCSLCHLSRTYPEIAPARLQQQLAISGSDGSWFLINASPDLRVQIESNPELQPSPARGRRNSPIGQIVLTSADLDQVLGVLLLREFQPLTIYSTGLVREVLEANTFFRMLHRVPGQLRWVEISPGISFELDGGITCTPVALPAALPFYAREFKGSGGQASLGLLLEVDGRRIAYTPSLPEITPALYELYKSCEVILVDGTFWSDAELSQTHAGTPLAREIGHLPMSGAEGSIAQLSGLTDVKKIFVHINNTNPVLDPRSREHYQLVDAGWKLGHDGWRLN